MSSCPPPPRLEPAVHTEPGKLSIVVLNWNAKPFLRRCLDSIVRHTRRPYELVLVDNGSTDGSNGWIGEFVEARPELDVVRVDHAENRFFSHGFNSGFRAASRESEFLLMICNDVEVKADDWVDPLIEAMRPPNVVAVGHANRGTRLPDEHREIYRRNAPRYDDADLERRMRGFVDDPVSRYTHLFGYSFLLRRRLLEHTGLYLEGGDFRQYHSDWEWYVRFAVLGYEIAAVPPRVHHWHSISELVAFHPERYRELLADLADPEVLERALRDGRQLYPEESGFRELERQKREERS